MMMLRMRVICAFIFSFGGSIALSTRFKHKKSNVTSKDKYYGHIRQKEHNPRCKIWSYDDLLILRATIPYESIWDISSAVVHYLKNGGSLNHFPYFDGRVWKRPLFPNDRYLQGGVPLGFSFSSWKRSGLSNVWFAAAAHAGLLHRRNVMLLKLIVKMHSATFWKARFTIDLVAFLWFSFAQAFVLFDESVRSTVELSKTCKDLKSSVYSDAVTKQLQNSFQFGDLVATENCFTLAARLGNTAVCHILAQAGADISKPLGHQCHAATPLSVWFESKKSLMLAKMFRADMLRKIMINNADFFRIVHPATDGNRDVIDMFLAFGGIRTSENGFKCDELASLLLELTRSDPVVHKSSMEKLKSYADLHAGEFVGGMDMDENFMPQIFDQLHGDCWAHAASKVLQHRVPVNFHVLFPWLREEDRFVTERLIHTLIVHLATWDGHDGGTFPKFVARVGPILGALTKIFYGADFHQMANEWMKGGLLMQILYSEGHRDHKMHAVAEKLWTENCFPLYLAERFKKSGHAIVLKDRRNVKEWEAVNSWGANAGGVYAEYQQRVIPGVDGHLKVNFFEDYGFEWRVAGLASGDSEADLESIARAFELEPIEMFEFARNYPGYIKLQPAQAARVLDKVAYEKEVHVVQFLVRRFEIDWT